MSDETEQDRYSINIAAYATRCTNDLARVRAERDAAQAREAALREAIHTAYQDATSWDEEFGVIFCRQCKAEIPDNENLYEIRHDRHGQGCSWGDVSAALSQPEPPMLARLKAAERVVAIAQRFVSLVETEYAEDQLGAIEVVWDDLVAALAARDGGADD